ncbi:hypothetical protein ACH427_16765 [Streptomyces sp. NPDC020379]|uniref:hypothetical protein n=1 Tax=Streptomyces sp. NPDC020379 TaxID=3365071 RepID=UPI0037967049
MLSGGGFREVLTRVGRARRRAAGAAHQRAPDPLQERQETQNWRKVVPSLWVCVEPPSPPQSGQGLGSYRQTTPCGML